MGLHGLLQGSLYLTIEYIYMELKKFEENIGNG
jgi:hypothetical protein